MREFLIFMKDLLRIGCHPFGPFSNVSKLRQLLQDVTLCVEAFAWEYLRTALGEPVKGKKNKTTTKLWLEKLYKKETILPEPFPHELVEWLETYLDSLEEQLVDLSSLLYDHLQQDSYMNGSDILESSIFTLQHVEHVLESEKERMKCCNIEYRNDHSVVKVSLMLSSSLQVSLRILLSFSFQFLSRDYPK